MIKVGLYSEDHSLSLFLSSALGKEFQVTLESEWEELNRLVSEQECEITILDLNSTHDALEILRLM